MEGTLWKTKKRDMAPLRGSVGVKRKCIYCNKQYWVYDQDAGSYKEHYCSEICEQEDEKVVGKQIDEFIKTRAEA